MGKTENFMIRKAPKKIPHITESLYSMGVV